MAAVEKGHKGTPPVGEVGRPQLAQCRRAILAEEMLALLATAVFHGADSVASTRGRSVDAI